jgi:hypothetical protein
MFLFIRWIYYFPKIDLAFTFKRIDAIIMAQEDIVMGGNAIKSAKRLTKAQFDQYWDELKVIFPEFKMERVAAFRQKQDFGDIDIVVEIRPDVDQKAVVFQRLGASIEHYNNGPFFSFLYKDAQVDFIFMSASTYQSALNYFAYNDVGNFIGRVARTLGFKYGHDGFFYEEHLDDHYKISVFVSDDMEKVLTFLGYDYHAWKNGFDTVEEILAYGASSTYFNALYFSLEEQNNVDRVRNKKRKMYQFMLKYIEDQKLLPRPKLTPSEKEEHYSRAIELFGDSFGMEVDDLKIEYAKHCKFKRYFNGDIVKELTGLEGKALGAFMQKIKAKYPNLEDIVLVGKEKIVSTIVGYEGMVDD